VYHHFCHYFAACVLLMLLQHQQLLAQMVQKQPTSDN
jgi:hypothetical protein